MPEGDILLLFPRKMSRKDQFYISKILKRNGDIANLYAVIIIENNEMGVRLAARLVQHTGGIKTVNSFLCGRLIYRSEWIPILDKWGKIAKGRLNYYLKQRMQLRKRPGFAVDETKLKSEADDAGSAAEGDPERADDTR